MNKCIEITQSTDKRFVFINENMDNYQTLYKHELIINSTLLLFCFTIKLFKYNFLYDSRKLGLTKYIER